MYIEEISLEEFKSDVSKLSGFCIDLNSLMQTCGVSPIRVHYKTDEIVLMTAYPERIVLKSGDSSVNISQIKKITRQMNGAKYAYEVLCGNLNGFETTVKITQS